MADDKFQGIESFIKTTKVSLIRHTMKKVFCRRRVNEIEKRLASIEQAIGSRPETKAPRWAWDRFWYNIGDATTLTDRIERLEKQLHAIKKYLHIEIYDEPSKTVVKKQSKKRKSSEED